MNRHPTDVNRLGLVGWASPNREVARNLVTGAPSNPELGGLCLKWRVTILFLRRSGDCWSCVLPATLPTAPVILSGRHSILRGGSLTQSGNFKDQVPRVQGSEHPLGIWPICQALGYAVVSVSSGFSVPCRISEVIWAANLLSV